MNLYQQANKVRNAGARYAPGDTELIHATPEEKAILKLLGGSGSIDPVTGLPHYYQDRGDGTDGHQGAGDNDAGGADGTGSNSGGYGEGSGGRSHQNDYNSTREAIANANYSDANAERASHFSTEGSVDPDAVASGTAYGIDAGPRTHSWSNFWNGVKKTPGGVAARVGGGVLGAIVGSPGSPQVNGGGWNTSNGGTTNNGSAWGNSTGGGTPSTGDGDTSSKGGGGSYWSSLPTGTTGNLGGTTGTGTTTGTTTTGSSIFPSIYTDPVTGRILNTAEASYDSNQQLLDQIMGTSLASTPLANASTNPLLQQINSGLQARVGNDNIDNTVANTMKANEDTMARRGMGMLASPLQDQVRASLGLSTAQARNANNLAAQESNWKKQADLLSFLKTGQTADTVTQLGLADLENQRKIAEITAALQEKLANKNLSYLKGVQDQNNTNSWINTAGDVLGSIDWGSLFS